MSMPGSYFFKESIVAYATMIVNIRFIKEYFASSCYRAVLNAGAACNTISEIMFNRIGTTGTGRVGAEHFYGECNTIKANQEGDGQDESHEPLGTSSSFFIYDSIRRSGIGQGYHILAIDFMSSVAWLFQKDIN